MKNTIVYVVSELVDYESAYVVGIFASFADAQAEVKRRIGKANAVALPSVGSILEAYSVTETHTFDRITIRAEVLQ
jgi:hypothetical protein